MIHFKKTWYRCCHCLRDDDDDDDDEDGIELHGWGKQVQLALTSVNRNTNIVKSQRTSPRLCSNNILQFIIFSSGRIGYSCIEFFGKIDVVIAINT